MNDYDGYEEYISLLKQTCNDINFGIEIETCIHFIENLKGSEFKNQGEVHEELMRCFNSISNSLELDDPNFKWTFFENEASRPTEYNNWTIMSDTSIGCPTKEESSTVCMSEGKYVDCNSINGLDFWQVE